MADYNSSYTGTQIESAIGSVITANNSGGIINTTSLNTALNTTPLIVFPVGSVYIMSTNTNPSTLFGGTWELIDKEFKYTYVDAFTPTLNTTNTTSATVQGFVTGHNIWIHFTWKNKTEINDGNDVQRFTINPNLFGVSTFFSENFCAFTDAGNSVIMYTLSSDGILYTQDRTTTVSAGTTLSVATKILTTSYTRMLDSWCNKFYFKRTA